MPTPTTRRFVFAVLAGATLAVGLLTATGSPTSEAVTPVSAAGTAEHQVRHLPPVPGEVWRPFEPPSSAYGHGHRGVDLGAEPGETVHASAAGVVVHAGAIAGITWVSIDHPDGLRTAYGPLTAVRVAAGQHVETAEEVGALAAGGHGHQRRDRGLHFSVRRNGAYLDPLGLFGRKVPSLHGPGGSAPLTHSPPMAAERPATGRLAVPGPPTPLASLR